MTRVLLAALALGLAPLGWPTDEDAAMEARFQSLAKELRCLVCQNQSLFDSPAELAADFRREIRAMMREGKSDDEIKAFLVARYGDFVLYRPPVKAKTYALWAAPFVLLGVGAFALVAIARGRRKVEEPPLDERERELAETLLGGAAERDLS
ncbi:MAG: cytochrome c-type biogenesis protein [Burkholderiales bacterium]